MVTQPNPLHEDELRELIAQGEKASSRPYAESGMRVVGGADWNEIADCWPTPRLPMDQGHSNAVYIASAANLAVPLASEVLRLREENDRLRQDQARTHDANVVLLLPGTTYLPSEDLERMRARLAEFEGTWWRRLLRWFR